MVFALISEKAANDLSLIPLSHDAFKERIDGLLAGIKEQLLEIVPMSQCVDLQLDKATLLYYVRYEHERNILISSLLHNTAEEE